MDINEIINQTRPAENIIKDLKRKNFTPRSWEELEREFEPKLHPVVTDKNYRDKVVRGVVQKVTRLTFGWQKLAVKRMTELMFAIPVKRIYKPQNDNEQKVAEIMEAVFAKNRIDSINIERGRNLYASCENVTIWYTQEQETIYAGERSPLKLRCKNFSPKDGYTIYPLFDDYDDLIALSVEFTRKEGEQKVTYFDTYTADCHIRWSKRGTTTAEELREDVALKKISGVYISRKEAIWEDQSENVYEAEWTMSRNGNYIRKNAKPNWVVYSDNVQEFGNSAGNDNDGRNVFHYGQNDRAGYATWAQAIDSIKFQVEEIKRNFFMQLQLPDMSMDNLKATPMSGEARKMMFIDAQLKVHDEKGPWLDIFDREINIIRAFMKLMFPELEDAIDSLQVETVITPYNINDDRERIENLSNAAGGKPIMSQKTAIINLGYVDDANEEIEQIKAESTHSLFEPEM